MNALPPRARGARRGFTLPELLVVLVLATLLIVALQSSLLQQRRFYDAQRAASERHETTRVALAVLGAAMREARLGEGDVDIVAPHRLRVRVPHGFAIACGADPLGLQVGFVAPRGQWRAATGDSVLIQRAGAFSAHAVSALSAGSALVPCSLTAGGFVVRPLPLAPLADAPAPARAFRSQWFESGQRAGATYLFRVDGPQREILLGPIDPSDGFRAWYEDAGGAPAPGPATADRVAVRVIAVSGRSPGSASERRDTITLRLGRRN